MPATVGRRVMRAALFVALGLGALVVGGLVAQAEASDQPVVQSSDSPAATATPTTAGLSGVQPLEFEW